MTRQQQQQHDSIAYLVTHCERLVTSGRLAADDAVRLRELTQTVCFTHGMQPICEREMEGANHGQ